MSAVSAILPDLKEANLFSGKACQKEDCKFHVQFQNACGGVVLCALAFQWSIGRSPRMWSLAFHGCISAFSDGTTTDGSRDVSWGD